MWRDELTRRFPALRALPEGCYVVGGAIRDLIAGREPLDVDVACPDPLEAAKRISDRVIRLGDQEHLSAWRVVLESHAYDFAPLLDGDIESDLGRRDFTVNAMAVRLDDGTLLDPHEGRSDLERGVVRMIVASNFDDDPLRTLKGVRMAVRYRMEIDEGTLDAIRERAGRIVEVAPERVTYELSLILGGGDLRRAVALLRRTRLDVPLGVETRELANDDVSLAGAYALLIPDPVAHARRWRWSQQLLREVLMLRGLIEKHDRLALHDAGEAVARQLPDVLLALGAPPDLDWPDFTIRPLLTGDEISALTRLPPGREIGKLKRALLEEQVWGRVRTRDEAEGFVRERMAG